MGEYYDPEVRDFCLVELSPSYQDVCIYFRVLFPDIL